MRYRLAYVLGSGHCGSTLLDLLLNAHPRVVALGEVGRIHGSGDEPPERAGPESDDFWRRVIRCCGAEPGESFSRIDLRSPRWREAGSWPPARVRAWARSNERVFACAAEVAGADVVTDTSKMPARLRLLLRSGRFDLRVIHLVRDGRAVVNSYRRKEMRLRPALIRWASPALRAPRLRRRLPSDAWLRVHYEALATAPEATLRRTCEFLGLAYTPAMLDYRRRSYAGIGGNRMRQGGGTAISLDERWRTELGTRERAAFAALGGWLNRVYGY